MIAIPSDILHQFSFNGNITDIHLCKYGHINDTFVVRTGLNGRSQRFILQRINHHVFRQPEALMTNIVRVTTFLREKIAAEGGDPERETLTLIPTRTGQLYHTTPEGDYWRSYRFVDGVRTFQQVESPEHLYQAARAFGRFMRLLDDFPAEELHETIPDFHHTPKRFNALTRAVDEDAHNRAWIARDLIALAENQVEKMGLVIEALEAGDLPHRVTHNDTKFDNVLIDEHTGEGICVVDLDTVMPGSALFDFGDFVRTGANTAPEDERNLDRVSLNLDYFDAIARGFMEETRGALTPLEREWLPLSAWLLTFEVAMRFLTDYLNGDVYFRIHRPDHNLERARAQFKLAADMEIKEGAMSHIVTRYS
jgi:Ser/Thr protein kinase RdoA (MazF antagonist)